MSEQGFGGCFSPYMLISSTMQTVLGFDKRSDQEIQLDLTQRHQLELRKAKEEFQDELEAKKMADMRAKMAIARKYRSEEKFEQTVLQHKTDELREFFMKYLPIKKKCISILLDEALQYKEAGYDASCPLNVVLLHARQNELDYEDICNTLDRTVLFLGNIVYQRWCDKDVAHNAAILNLHAIMGNIPTLVISPFFQEGVLHINTALWEAQSEMKPLIRPLFSFECPKDYFGLGQRLTSEGKIAIQKQLSFVSTIVSGCARDSYMLMTQGLTPTLPLFLKNNPKVLVELTRPENRQVREFMLNEYSAVKSLLGEAECTSKLLSKDEMGALADEAAKAERKLLALI